MKELINNIEIEVVAYKDAFLVSNKEVAQAFGVGDRAIQQHKDRSEFTEGKHYVEQLVPGTRNKYRNMWTRRGIIRLGFKLQETEFTIAFRDWAEDYIINGGEQVVPMTNEQIMANAMVIAQKTLSDMTNKVEALSGANNLLVNKNEILYGKVADAQEEIRERDNVIEFISDRSKSILIGDWAKLLYDIGGAKIGPQRLFKILKAMGYLGQYSNTPKQTWINQKLFDTKISQYIDQNTGEKKWAEPTPLVTQKGIDKLSPKIVEYFLANQ